MNQVSRAYRDSPEGQAWLEQGRQYLQRNRTDLWYALQSKNPQASKRVQHDPQAQHLMERAGQFMTQYQTHEVTQQLTWMPPDMAHTVLAGVPDEVKEPAPVMAMRLPPPAPHPPVGGSPPGDGGRGYGGRDGRSGG
jgi:hypothetical protein